MTETKRSSASVFDTERRHFAATVGAAAHLRRLSWLGWLGVVVLVVLLGEIGTLIWLLRQPTAPAQTHIIVESRPPSTVPAKTFRTTIFPSGEHHWCEDVPDEQTPKKGTRKRPKPSTYDCRSDEFSADDLARCSNKWVGFEDSKNFCRDVWLPELDRHDLRQTVVVVSGGHDLTRLGKSAQECHDSNYNLAYRRAKRVLKYLEECEIPKYRDKDSRLPKYQTLMLVSGSGRKDSPEDRRVSVTLLELPR